MGKTTIEWAQHSINPFRARNIESGKVGHFCVKLSPGCKNCYSSRMQKPFLTQLEFVAENRPKVELFIDEHALQEVLRRRIPTEYFWADMTDMFLHDYPREWIDRCFAVMAMTPRHTHMVLTKRPERMHECIGPINHGHMVEAIDIGTANVRSGSWITPLDNLRIGVSVENRAAKHRIDTLRKVPAALRFLSIEPLLEDIGALDLTGIQWVIAGAESGPGARPCEEQWVRNVKDQCVAAGVAFFYKQASINGKKISTPELDGRRWMEFPTVREVVTA